ncbi:MAG: AAA family ATPase, partial [Oscillospiraceae bacterium]|nr:AAA family ATPase [Oscillospiraceae bacterium]
MLGEFDVIRLVMTDFMDDCDSVQDMLNYLTEEVVEELRDAFPDVNFESKITLRNVLNKIYGKTGRQFVIVIDEWDAVFRTWKKDTEGQKKYLDYLRNLLKDKPYIALAYMTGILPIKKYGRHSALNMFDEYSMMNPMQLAPYTGFITEEALELTRQYGRDFESIKDWYDGYNVSDIVPPDPDHSSQKETGKVPEARRYDLYCPLSVVNAVRTGKIQNYWNKTETYEALAEYIRMDYDGLKESVALLMNGGKLHVDTSGYQNDMTTFTCRDDVLSLLVHLGYLGYDDETSEVFIPNKEILDEFRTSTRSSEWLDTFESFRISQELLKATWNKDTEKVAELIEKAHNKADNKTYNDEAALSYAIRFAYYAAQKYYTILPEADTGKGYADLILLPSPEYADKPALVIELKYNKDASGAVEQIKRKDYPDRLEHFKGNILLVGINYDKEIPASDPNYKHHSCIIEDA